MRHPAYKPSGTPWLGDVPEHWELHSIKSGVRLFYTGAWGVEEGSDTVDAVCIRVADFDYERLGVQLSDPTTRSYPQSVYQEKKLKAGDILLEKSGGGEKTPVGRAVIWEQTQKALCSNFIGVLRLQPTENSKYWTYQLSSLYQNRVFAQYIKQSTGIQNLDIDAFKAVTVLHPPLSEQEAIAAYLDRKTAEVDAARADLEALIERLGEYRTTVITQAVTRGLDPTAPLKPSGIPWLGDVPEHWEVKRLSQCFQLINGHPFSSEYFDPIEGHDLVRIRDIHSSNTEVKFNGEWVEKATICPGELLVGMDGDFEVAKWQGSKALLNQRVCLLRPFDRLYGEYVWRFLAEPLRYINDLTYSTTVKHISSNQIASITLPYPPFSEQEAIAAYLDRKTAEIDDAVADAQQQLALLAEYRTALITAAVTGQVDVRGLTKTPPTV